MDNDEFKEEASKLVGDIAIAIIDVGWVIKAGRPEGAVSSIIIFDRYSEGWKNLAKRVMNLVEQA